MYFRTGMNKFTTDLHRYDLNLQRKFSDDICQSTKNPLKLYF